MCEVFVAPCCWITIWFCPPWSLPFLLAVCSVFSAWNKNIFFRSWKGSWWGLLAGAVETKLANFLPSPLYVSTFIVTFDMYFLNIEMGLSIFLKVFAKKRNIFVKYIKLVGIAGRGSWDQTSEFPAFFLYVSTFIDMHLFSVFSFPHDFCIDIVFV